MALDQEYQEKSLIELRIRYKNKLTAKSNKLLKAINDAAAADSVWLSKQTEEVLEIVSNQLEKSFDESKVKDVADSIYALLIEQMNRETDENRRRHQAVGSFDIKYIHQRSLRDQLQDHDMTLLMPKSHGNIEVLANVNRFDPKSIAAVQEGLAKALEDPGCRHIFISIGPGHWRGIYLSKPPGGNGKYQLELFDPYGSIGANAIKDIALDMLKKCGIQESQVTIETTGPDRPQRDAYACGDFTCAYSHKKMKQLGARTSAYNTNLVKVLDSHGNEKDLLRHESQKQSKLLVESRNRNQEQEGREVSFSETEKREFFIRLSKLCSDPTQLDKAVLGIQIAKIKSTLGSSKFASLAELDAYGVFNSDGSINKEIATQYHIRFEENQIKNRLEAYGFKHLSFREMIVFESVISAVINELTIENDKKVAILEDEIQVLLKNTDEQSEDRMEEIELKIQYIKSHPPIMGLAKECFSELHPLSNFQLVHPLSMELSGPTRQMIGMGYFKFKELNVSISPGPFSARSLVNPKQVYESQHDIARFLNNLLIKNVSQVFAMGRVFPYHPQGTDGQREITTEFIVDDFINYFIPDADGVVRLPNIPELKDIHINSRPIKKVGRFITYEISINGSTPIQVHHFPVRDKQPLELTQRELAFVKEVAQTTPSYQNIHTHCKGGRGGSAQIAYLLASLTPQYGELEHDQRLARMRAEKVLKEEPKYLNDFIETPLQEENIEYSGSLIKEDIAPEDHDEENIQPYILYGTLLKQEIEKHLRQIGRPQDTAKEENVAILDLMEKYQELSSVPANQLARWIENVCINPLVSERTKTLLKTGINATGLLLQAFKDRRLGLTLLFDLQSLHGNYEEILRRFDEILPDQVQIAPEQFDKYKSLFIDHLQNAFLKNFSNLRVQSFS